MSELSDNLNSWNRVTESLPWGVQNVLRDTLGMVAEGKVSLVHGADYRNGRPCLINAASVMFTTDDAGLSPSNFNSMIVTLFDRINADLVNSGVNDGTGYVSPLAAEILIRNFGTPADEPEPQPVMLPYKEASDAELSADWEAAETAKAWLDSMAIAPVSEVLSGDDEYAKQYVVARVFTEEDEYH